MWLAIILLLLAGALLFLSGIPDDGRVSLMEVVVGVAIGTIGTIIMYYSGFGNPCIPGAMPIEPIYVVSGRAETSRGTVFIVEDAQMNVFCIWGEANDYQRAIPEGTKFVKVNKEGPKPSRFLEPVASE
jgi:hypothetical protein